MLLPLFIGAWSIAANGQTADSLVAAEKAKQGPCPKGMIFIKASGQTTSDDSTGIPLKTVDYYPAWPWQDCKTGQYFDKPPKKKTTIETSVYYFTYRTDTVFCAIEREVIVPKKEVWVESRCEIEDRTPKEPDTSWANYKAYPLLSAGKSKFTVKLGTGFRGTQYYAVRKDSLAPWQRRYLQVTWGAEMAAAVATEDNPLRPKCTNCGNLTEKKDPGMDIGFDSKIFVYVEGRGKRALLKSSPKYEVRWLAGTAYHITELYEGKTQNRGEDGIAVVGGVGIVANNPKGLDKKFNGPEVELNVETRPFANWEIHVNLAIRGLFGGSFEPGTNSNSQPGWIQKSGNWFTKITWEKSLKPATKWAVRKTAQLWKWATKKKSKVKG